MSLLFFDGAEQFNRAVAFLGGINKAQREGLSAGKAATAAAKTMNKITPAQAIKYGEGVLDRTQHIYSSGNKPELLRNTFLRVPLQFKNFLAQQLTFMFGLKGAEIPRFLLALSLVTGGLGIPGLDLLDAIMEGFYEFSPIAGDEKSWRWRLWPGVRCRAVRRSPSCAAYRDWLA